MITEPKIEHRNEQPYVGLRAQVTMQELGKLLPPLWGNTKFSLAPPDQGLADARGPGYGRWAQTSDREFKLMFYAVL